MKRILIAYASRAGSTAEVAEKIGEVLESLGFYVDVKSVKDITSINDYDGIIIGSAVRKFRLLPETVRFARRFSNLFMNKPVAYFIVCLTMKEDSEKSRKIALGYLKPLYDIKEPIDVGLFAGKMDYSKLSFIWRKLFSSLKKKELEEGDFRNWDLITDWAKRVGDIFSKTGL